MPVTRAHTVYARFGTLLGAVVTLTRAPRSGDSVPEYHWECGGCRDTSYTGNTQVKAVRDLANAHAASCRALPAER